MSAKSFLDEFYPKPAKRAINTIVEAADHSYQKWLGRLPENLEKHACFTMSRYIHAEGTIEDPVILTYGDSTCSLCHWSRQNNTALRNYCKVCPITQLIGQFCDDYDADTEESSPYWRGIDEYPNEMIELLHKVRMFVRLNELPRTVPWCSSPIME